jgi:hypothetical protein
MLLAMERLLSALEGVVAADFAAMYVTKRWFENVYSRWCDSQYRIQYGTEEAKDGTADEEETLCRQFPYVVFEYRYRNIDDITWIRVRSRRPRPEKAGASVSKATVTFTRFMHSGDTASNASNILRLLSDGYVYEGDTKVEADFSSKYELGVTFVKRDPRQRTMWEQTTGRNKQPSDPMQRCC